MKKRYKGAMLAAGMAVCLGIVFPAAAQWDQSEEQDRLREQQQDRYDEATRDRLQGTSVPVPSRTTKGERKLMELTNISTGYLYREFTIKQSLMRGNWGKTQVVPAYGFESQWAYVLPKYYQGALAGGVDVAKLKATPYAPFVDQMKKACAAGVKTKSSIHVQAPGADEDWLSTQDPDPPHLLYRELTFQCLAEGDRN